MKIKQTALSAAFLAALSLPASAVITWTGAVDGDISNDGNWDASVVGITNATLNDSLIFNTSGSAPVLGEQAAQPTWGVTAANTITFDGVSMTNSGNDGIGTGIINIINGGGATAFFAFGTITVDATSSMNLQGGGDPLPGAAVLNLAPGATLTMASVAEFTEQGAQIFVNGVDFATDTSILSFSGTTATAVAPVPEPSSAALLGLGGLALIMRRRK